MDPAPVASGPRVVVTNPFMHEPQASVAHRPRPAASRWLAAAALACAAAWQAAVLAQDPASPVAAPQRIEERKPEIYYLENDAGRLVPVPGFRYRDFVDLLRLKEGLPGPAQPPAAVLEEIRVQADLAATADGACPVTVVCTIRQSRPGWVDVPLGSAGLILARPPGYRGPGRLLVDAGSDGRGYRAWLEAAAEPGQEPRHVVTLEGRLPVEAIGGGESLALDLPPATTSAVELRSSRRDPEVAVQPPAARQEVRDREGGGSIVTLSGLGGTAVVRLGDRSATADGRWIAAEASVESVVRIDGRDAVTQARIRLGGLPPGTPTVRITLPPAAKLRGVRGPAAAAVPDGDATGDVVEVAVVRGADGGAVIELECQRPLDRAAGAQEAGPYELAGFVVEGIEPWRQWGRISLVVEGDWQAVWSEGLRRVDPPAAGRRPGLVAAFAYDAQPASLKVRVLPRNSRVVIEPEYRYDVSAERIAMQARLRVAASGAPATDVVLDVDPAWAIDEVGPAGVVDVAGVTTEGGRVRIPFAQPLTGNAVVELRGGRAVDRETERLSWRLPSPVTGLVGPATVVVAADSNIELLPDNERIKGLSRQTAAAVSRPAAEDIVLAYRLDARTGEFAATRRYLPRRVDATIAVQAMLDESATVVTETIRLNVMHVPLEFVELLVPAAVAAGGSLEARQGEWVLDPVEVPDEEGAVGGGMVRLRAILPSQLLGGGEVVVRYVVPTPPVPPETTVTHDLPLVLPPAARILRQTFLLDAPERLAVEVRSDAWRRDAGTQPNAVARVWSTTRQQAVVPLALAARRRSDAGGLAIDAALLRTTVLADRREDVFSYALSGAADSVSLTLPPGPVEIRLDGRPVAAGSRPDGGVSLELPRGGVGRWLLEIRRIVPREDRWERLATRFGLPVRVPLVPPRFGDDVVERRFTWEVDSRSDEWLFGAPSSWTGQQGWQWQGLLPDRQPVVSRGELEAWVLAAAAPAGARLATPEAAPAGRRAVYSGLGGPGPAAPWLLPFWFVVLVCSGATLAFALACRRFAPLRRQGTLLASAGAIVLAAAAAPDVAPLAAIAAAPGALLGCLAWLLERLAESRDGSRGGGSGLRPAASSLVRTDGPPSLVIAGSVAAADGETAAHGPVP